ncbi:DUF2971 domain-containing protein [Yoonia sp. R2331]|uniref:DUF2971 domain-containing protein n=1 Tax=Yoonia sp. R2331 TaxID=3237238 RepID=UPI0034E4B060
MELNREDYLRIFNPILAERYQTLANEKFDLVHYTSASNALRILNDQRVSLRNASLMNDFSEIDHGEKCIVEAWKSVHGRGNGQIPNGELFNLLHDISPVIFPAVEQTFDKVLHQRRIDSFLLSLAEHDEKSEGTLGRLSMWRAYGGRTNVALVLNNFSETPDEASGAFTVPVTYSNFEQFSTDHFPKLVAALRDNIETLKCMSPDQIARAVSWTLHTLSISIKHPGFSEEREWRILYAPWLISDDEIESRVVDIGGIPQKVFDLDLSPNRNTDRPWRQIPNLLKKVIIGPTEHPWVLYEAFVIELENLGISDAGSKVIVSEIPIRRR